ncbi:MAG: hypothetical protein ACXACK_17930 [Candidatus Hodarchaeales archaeon]
MLGNYISAKVSKQPYHECLYLITSHDDTLAYCLNLKHWNEPCPLRCPYYKSGSPGSLEKLEARHYQLNCRKFIRKISLSKQASAFCNLYFMREPHCRKCNYPQK